MDWTFSHFCKLLQLAGKKPVEKCIEKQVGVLMGIWHVSHLYMGTLEMIKYDITCVKYIYGTVLFNLNKTVVVFEPIHLKNMFIATSSSSPSFATTYPVKVVWTAIKATPTKAFQKYITWNLRFFVDDWQKNSEPKAWWYTVVIKSSHSSFLVWGPVALDSKGALK